ncbi:MAG: phenylacetate--CoA ligase [Desulfobacterales bacterium]|nr:phenylacetate--CoA ligase [Desulfobacterales bacterium]
MYWEKEIETIPRESLLELQLTRLKESLKKASASPFYGKVFKEMGFDPSQFHSIEDLQSIPFTTKEDLRRNRPYGFTAVPKKKLIRVHLSSEIIDDRALAVFHTADDIDQWADVMARSMAMTGMSDNDVFQNMLPYGLLTGGLGFHYGAEKIGALVIPAGVENSRRQIQLMQDFETTVIHISPIYALHLSVVFQEIGIDPRKHTHLKTAFIGAEPHSEKTRDKIEELFGIKVFNSYGLSEMNGPGVSFECPARMGMHVWEDHFFVEIIDPNTLKPVSDGQPGELVLTTLLRQGMPLLRYRTRDLTRVIPEPCKCGRTHKRIERISGRTDDMMIIKGVNIYPSQIEKKLANLPGTGPNFMIILEREGLNDHMIIKVEVQKEFFSGNLKQLENLRQKIIEALKTDIPITPKVKLVEPNTLAKIEGRFVRVIDNRKDLYF